MYRGECVKLEKFRTIAEKTYAEIEEKRSRFIANLYYIENIEEAENIIKQTKKEYYDARHNCYAYVVKEGAIIKRFSDDGEPSGTAGSPILNVLEKNDLCNILLIVTRYFGGILLGAGGLVRAYTEAATKAVNMANIVNQEEGYELEITISYQDLEKLRYYCNKNKIKIVKIEYEENAKCLLEVNDEEKEKMLDNKYDDKMADILEYKVKRKKYIRK